MQQAGAIALFHSVCGGTERPSILSCNARIAQPTDVLVLCIAGRAWRMGQQRKVTVKRFYVKVGRLVRLVAVCFCTRWYRSRCLCIQCAVWWQCRIAAGICSWIA
jgi:hypothetical protein